MEKPDLPRNPSKWKILCVSASPRRGGNTDTLIEEAARGAESVEAETDTVYLRDYVISPCVACEQCRRDKTCTRFFDGMHLLYSKIEEAGGLIVGSPTYNYNITSSMKSFIDRLYPYFDFENPRPGPYRSRLAEQERRAVIVGVCEQKEESEMGFTIPAMRDPLEVLGYATSGVVPILGHFPKGSVKKDEVSLRTAYEGGQNLAKELLKEQNGKFV